MALNLQIKQTAALKRVLRTGKQGLLFPEHILSSVSLKTFPKLHHKTQAPTTKSNALLCVTASLLLALLPLALLAATSWRDFWMGQKKLVWL